MQGTDLILAAWVAENKYVFCAVLTGRGPSLACITWLLVRGNAPAVRIGASLRSAEEWVASSHSLQILSLRSWWCQFPFPRTISPNVTNRQKRSPFHYFRSSNVWALEQTVTMIGTDPTCISHLPHCCDKTSDRSSLKKEALFVCLLFTHSENTMSTMTGSCDSRAQGHRSHGICRGHLSDLPCLPSVPSFQDPRPWSSAVHI